MIVVLKSDGQALEVRICTTHGCQTGLSDGSIKLEGGDKRPQQPIKLLGHESAQDFVIVWEKLEDSQPKISWPLRRHNAKLDR